MSRPNELARVLPFIIPALNWRITDLRDEPLSRQRRSQILWHEVIARELEERAIPAEDLICGHRVFQRDQDRLALQLDEERRTDPNITAREIEDRGFLVEKSEDVDVRLRQVFLAVADINTGNIVGGISFTNLHRLATSTPANFDARGILLCGVPATGHRTQIQTWIILGRRLINQPMHLASGREFNFMEWTVFKGSSRKTDLSTRNLFEAFAADEFNVIGSVDEPGPIRVRRRVAASA